MKEPTRVTPSRATTRMRSAGHQVLAAVGAKLVAEGFTALQDVPGVGRWWRPVPSLRLARLEVWLGMEPSRGDLEVGCSAEVQLSPMLVEQVPPEVRSWWLDSAGVTVSAALVYFDHEDRPGQDYVGMEIVDLNDPNRTADDVVFATLDQVVIPGVAELSSAEALATWASTPQVYGRFHGGIVRSCIVELCLLGRENLVPGVMAAFERGPLSRNDADHPESWAAFKTWIASVPPEQWAEWAQLPA